MAYLTTDPMEAIIADGRIKPRPIIHYGAPKVLTVDLDLMAASLQRNLESIFLFDHRVQKRYGTNHHITADTTAMVDFAVAMTYNHLRTTLELKCSHVRPERMNPRCPIPNGMEFPTWISSSTLGSIGSCRHGNTLLVYASDASTMKTYGRKNMPVFAYESYARLMQVLKEFGVATAPFPPLLRPLTGRIQGSSYFPTIQPEVEGHTWQLYGYVHESCYENEDVARIALVTSEVGATPFEQVGMTVGNVDDGTTMSPGRGADPYYQCLLGHSIFTTEVLQMLRYRIMHAT